MLSEEEIGAFLADGYIALRGAVPAPVIAACQDMIWAELGRQGARRDDPATWTAPVVRIDCPEGGPFAAAGTTPVLQEACDQLIGPGRWWRREGVGGTIPVRFPSEADPGDAGWHIEASYEEAGQRRVNAGSRARGLLAIYLLSDVEPDGAPTRVRPGSHRDVPPLLAPAGRRAWMAACRRSGPRRPARTVPPPWPRAGPVTCSCATRSWSTRRPGRTGAGPRGSSPSLAWRCTASTRCAPTRGRRRRRCSGPFSRACPPPADVAGRQRSDLTSRAASRAQPQDRVMPPPPWP